MTQAVAITVGEPSGIGPDILIKLANNHSFAVPLVLIANRRLLLQRAQQMGERMTLPDYQPGSSAPVSLLEMPLNENNPADFVIAVLKKAVAGCLSAEFSAMVTAPVNKALIKQSGEDFLGHTEYLAKLTGAQSTLMLFVYQTMRLGLLTTHMPLREVPRHINHHNISEAINLMQQHLVAQCGIKHPNILVTGVNPHAGEQGHLGTEERDIIEPSLNALRQQGFNLIGPVAADTAFHLAKQQNVDVILSMYHDQLLPVIKTLAFGALVNVTLGLPIVRTSVDHGTAFDLVGTGKADESSLVAATQLAIELT